MEHLRISLLLLFVHRVPVEVEDLKKLPLAAGMLGLTSSLAEYGVAKSWKECSTDLQHRRSAYLSGNEEPYGWTGPDDGCNQEGCKHDFWGSRCRFRSEPSCPLHLRQEISGWLRYWQRQGAQWAEKVLLQQPCSLWPLIQGRTVWIAGDSMSQEFALSLNCFMLEYLRPDHKFRDPRGYFPRYSETLVANLEANVKNRRLAYWCAALEDDTQICYLNADFGPQMVRLLKMAHKFISKEDIIVANLGLHYNSMPKLQKDAQDLAAAISEIRSDLPRRIYWKETTPQHYLTETGLPDWSRPVTEHICVPPGSFHGVNVTMHSDGSLGTEGLPLHPPAQSLSKALRNLLSGGSRNAHSSPPLEVAGVKVLRVWNTSLALWQVHRNVHPPGSGGACAELPCDCTHACIPSWGTIAITKLQELLEEDAHVKFSSA